MNPATKEKSKDTQKVGSHLLGLHMKGESTNATE
jgi:hypothetical protein